MGNEYPIKVSNFRVSTVSRITPNYFFLCITEFPLHSFICQHSLVTSPETGTYCLNNLLLFAELIVLPGRTNLDIIIKDSTKPNSKKKLLLTAR